MNTYPEIDELRRQNEALRIENELLKSENKSIADKIIESISEVVWLRSADDNKMLYVSPAYENLFGSSPEKLYENPNSFMDGIVEDDLPSFNKAIIEYQKTGLFECEYRIKHPDGQIKWIWARTNPVYGDDGEIKFMTGIATDITKQKISEEELKLKQTYERALLDNFPFFVWLKDTESRFLTANKFFAKSAGLGSVEDFAGKTDLDIWPKDLAESYRNDDFDVMKSLKKKEVEEEVEVEGKRFWIETYKAPVKDESGKLLGTVGFARDISERKKASKLMDSFFNQPITLNVIVDNEGNILRFNDGWFHILGYDKNEIIEKNIFDFIVEGDKGITIKELKNLSKGKKTYYFENRYKHKNGTERHVAWSAIPDGQENLIYGVGIDVTQIKKAHLEALEERDRANYIIEGTNAGTWEWNVQTGEVNFNERWAEMLGYTLDEIMPLGIDTWNKYTHPDDLEESNRKIEEHFAGKSDYYFAECRMRHKSGRWVWIQDRGKLISRTTEGKPLKMFGTHLDITGKKNAEEKLRFSEKKFRSYIENAPLGIFQADSKGNYTDVNQFSCKLTGYSREELLSMNLSELVAPEGILQGKEHFERLKKYGYSSGESLLKRKDGTLFFCLIDAVKIDNNSFLGFVTDITKLKETESALRERIKEQKCLYNISRELNTEVDFDKIAPKIHEHIREGFLHPEITLPVINIDNNIYPELPDISDNLSNIAAEIYCSDIKRGTLKVFYTDNKNFLPEEVSLTNSIAKSIGNWLERQDATKALLEAEHSLRENNAFISNILNKLPVGITVMDSKFRYVFMNDTMEEFIGIEDLDYTGKNAFELFPELEKSGLKDFILRAMAGETITTPDYKHLLDQSRWFSTIYYPNRDSRGNIIGVIGQVSDITKRKNALEALRLSQARYKAFFDNNYSPMLFIDPSDGRIVDANDSAVEYYKYSKDELTKMTIDEINIGNREYVFEKLQQAIRQKKYHFYFKHKLGNGEIRDVEIYGGIVYYQNRELNSSIIHDITEELKIKKELHQQNIELKIAKEKAEESEKLKSAFLANMSHEIRTPMNGILGFANLLKDGELTEEEQEQYIDLIENSGKRLLNTINDIISISKIEAGQEKINKTKIYINSEFDFLYNFFKPELNGKNIELKLHKELDAPDIYIVSDREKINVILNNLIKNAIKYTKKGKIEFGYKTSDSEIEIFVRDTGIGIAPDKHAAIFDRFIQADLSYTKPYEGSGLGLAITKSYVEMLGGKIELQSEPGKGSEFIVKLPCEICNPVPDEWVNSEEEVVKDDFSGMSLLIADDDATSVKLLEKLLKIHFGSVLTAKNGAEAVEIMKVNQDINLILMDLKMPVLDGFEATRKIKEFNNEVIIIAQSAYAMDNDKEKSINSGFDDYISKPIDTRGLIKIIEKHIH